jgi:surface polysaccharide O-acyltransferase-like enzyme
LIDRRLDFRGLGGWSPVQYALFFFAGMVVPQHEGLRARLVRVAVPALVCGLAVGAIYAFTPVESFHHVPRAMRRLFRATGSWGVLLGMLGCADRWLRHGRWIAPLNEASLPFYIFHQTVILLFALWLLSWEIAPGVKYIVLATLAFLTTTGLTAAVVRAPWVRPLFGLKLERQRA